MLASDRIAIHSTAVRYAERAYTSTNRTQDRLTSTDVFEFGQRSHLVCVRQTFSTVLGPESLLGYVSGMILMHPMLRSVQGYFIRE